MIRFKSMIANQNQYFEWMYFKKTVNESKNAFVFKRFDMITSDVALGC